MPCARSLPQSRRSRDGDGSRPQTDGKNTASTKPIWSSRKSVNLKRRFRQVTLTVPRWHPSFTRWTTCSEPAPSSRRQEIRGSVTNPNERFKSTAPKQSLTSPSTSLEFFAVRFSKITETTSKRSPKAQTPGSTTHRRNQRWLIRSVRNGLTRSRTVFAICSSFSRPSRTNTRSATLQDCTPKPPATSLTFSPRTKILKMR